MNDSNPGLGIHLTQETDLRGQAIRQAGIDNAAAMPRPNPRPWATLRVRPTR